MANEAPPQTDESCVLGGLGHNQRGLATEAQRHRDSQDEPLDPVFEEPCVEVDQQAGLLSRDLEVSE